MTTQTTQPKDKFSATAISRRRLVLLIVLLLLLYVAIPRIGNVTEGVEIFWRAHPFYLLVGIALTTCTYVITGTVYAMMAKRKVSVRESILVQAATALTNRLLPAGIGSMGLNAAFLQKRNHTLNQALSVVAANNTLGFLGHVVLFILIFLTTDTAVLGFHPHFNLQALYVTVAVLVFFIVNLFVFRTLRQRIIRSTLSVLQGMLEYSNHPRKASLALLLSMSLTMCYAVTLYVSSLALDVTIGFAPVFLLFTVATFIGTITPTPGGLVGIEAALVAGFAAYGIDTGHALAITLLYRFITYWLPIVPGFFAFRHVQRAYL